MSEMSYLEKLLDGVEVEWLPLGHIAAIKTGQSVNKNMISKNPGVYPVINSGREPLGFINTWNTDNDPIGITTRGAGVGSVIWQEGKYFRGNLNYSITIDKKNHINIRYMYHALLHMKNDIHELCTFDGIPALNAGSLKKLLIPIPCPDNPEKSLAIQSEIVRILDKFTALTAELTAELNMRKKQYNYYRDQLLSFEDGEVEWKALGTICQIGDGNHSSKYPKANEMIEQGIPFIRGTNMVNGTICNQDMKYISKEKHNELKKGHLKAFDVLIANRGEVGKVAYVPEGYSGSNLNSQLAWLRANPEIIINRYLFFILCSSTIQNKLSGEGGALQQLTIKNIKNIQIPVPSITVQSNIVSFLDKFDSLTNSISEGLPREIELRQKQYEYYRDLLFSFPKPDTVSN
ncbi:restriction endonuclease subunit S [Escherichia coli]|nr:restriction endonuclease subunit S [Escherichia coli]EFN5717269.1 restriction endonuclease subunit S [Escherichia coli]